MAKRAKPFEKWEFDQLGETFGLKRIYRHFEPLESFLRDDLPPIADTEKGRIEELQNFLFENIDSWNEDELKSFFIIPLIQIVNFNRFQVYKSFTQRTLEAKVKDVNGNSVNLRGRVEFIVATGVRSPQKPFFFLHEYKPDPTMGGVSDALGQLLAAMLVTQRNNVPEKELYGSYVIGRNWYFVLLIGNEYSVSPSFDATQEDIYKTVSLLKKIKNNIESYLLMAENA
jgi:hypothetical protein